MLLVSIAKACRIKNDKVQTRLPISVGMLDLILGEIGKIFKNQTYLKVMYRTMFAFAFYGLLRIGEVAQSPHVAKAKDVSIGTNKNKVLIVLYSSKTHGQESHPQKVKISKWGNSVRLFCPFNLINSYKKLRPDYINDSEQFFVFPQRNTR